MTNENTKNWYAIRVATNRENQAMTSIEALIERESLHDSFGQIIVPTEEVFEMRNGQNVRPKGSLGTYCLKWFTQMKFGIKSKDYHKS